MKTLTEETKNNILQDYLNENMKVREIADKYRLQGWEVTAIAVEMGATPRRGSFGEHEVKTDCFAYMKKCKQCSVLNELVCKKRECTFYKTREQYDADRLKYDSLVAAKLKL